jgi:sugar phosphate isomerase/epimerase
MRLGVRGPLAGATLRERAALLKRTGFDGIELGHEWLDRSASEIKEELEPEGIAVSAIVGSINLLNTDARERRKGVDIDRARLRMARNLGASAVIEVPTFGSCKFPDTSPVISPWNLERDLLVAGLKELVPDVRETGVNLILEPLNRYETHFLNRQEQGVEMCKAVGAPGFKLLSDLFHMHIEERSVPNAIKESGEYVGYVHIADSNRLQPGAGFTDFGAAFAALKSIGYDGWLVIESGADGDVETVLARSSELLRNTWAGC